MSALSRDPKANPLSSAECAAVFRAMADETRLRILRVLFLRERSVTEICEALDVEQHFASRHLGVLRHAGLVVARREAQRMIYGLHPTVHGELAADDGTIDLGCCEVRFLPAREPEQPAEDAGP